VDRRQQQRLQQPVPRAVGHHVDQIANYSDPAIYPLEDAAKNPATKQLLEIFKKYDPTPTSPTRW
jgi:hypothetical protein